MIEIFQYEFMRNALVATLLVSIACGIVGTYVIIKRIVFISGGISHSALGGIGLGYMLGLNPILTTIPFTVFTALSIGVISRRLKMSEDVAIGILWAVGMASGVIFISLRPGYASDLFSYLFGSILAVSPFDLVVMLLLDVVIITFFLLFYREFLAISFDEEFSKVVGIPVRSLYLLLLCLVALSVVVLIRVVGIILVIALLTIPAAISSQLIYSIKKLVFFSIFTGMCLTMTGLWLSYMLNLPSGATIVLVLGAAFTLLLIFKRRH
ncbi:MAG: metal ABC transporter permease [Candidatus Bathyarchaeota archaeon]|nr:metal ABC transporter permease [Candidatus Bathyarchaeota archaeon]